MAPRKENRIKVQPAQRKRKQDLIGLEAGHHAIVSGATKSGKTEYIVDAILGEGVHEGHASPWDAVVVLCDSMSIGQPAFKRLEKGFTGAGGVTFIVGLPRSQDEEEGLMERFEKNHNNKWKTLCVIDDLMIDARKGSGKEFVDKLFTSGRHKGVDVYQLTQAHTDSRTRRLQVGYLICFSTPADVASLAHIARSIRPETKGHDVIAAYRTATESYNGHGCLVICLKQPNEYMFRNTRMDTCFDLSALPVDENGVTRLGATLY